MIGISLSKTVKAEKSSIAKEHVSKEEPSLTIKEFVSEEEPSSTVKETVSEEEIRFVLMEKKKVTILDLVTRFKGRLKTKEEKYAFAAILKKIAKIQKKVGSKSILVLKK
ncbi:unnamed protein product [Cochlearia groenlandica]